MKNFSDDIRDLDDLFSKLVGLEQDLIARAGTTDKAALEKIVKDCIDMDASPLEPAKAMAQTMLPKALAAKQLTGFFAQADMIDGYVTQLKDFLGSIIEAGEESLK